MGFIFLLGLVSLFADFVYEGSRSILGPYLLLSGAGVIFVSFIAGFGEFIGYFLRILFGYWADKTKKYWLFILIGYGLTCLTVPLMAFTNNYVIIGILVLLERLGKSIRTPSRDTIISFVGSRYGQGTSFGIHQFLDQMGAILGPIFISFILFMGNNDYKLSFLLLSIPAVFTMSLLFWAKHKYSLMDQIEKNSESKKNFESKNNSKNIRDFKQSRDFRQSRNFWIYTIASGFIAFGFIDFFLISYHYKLLGLVSDGVIPLVYSFAMFVAGLSSLVLGRIFDRYGVGVLLFSVFFASFSSFMIFLFKSYLVIWVSMVFWGLGLGVQGSVMKAYISKIVDRDQRAFAFGIFNSVYGISWFLGSVLMGYLYKVDIFYMVFISFMSQILGLLIFIFGLFNSRLS